MMNSYEAAGSPRITSSRVYKPHAVNARARSMYFTAEITAVTGQVFLVLGFETETLARDFIASKRTLR